MRLKSLRLRLEQAFDHEIVRQLDAGNITDAFQTSAYSGHPDVDYHFLRLSGTLDVKALMDALEAAVPATESAEV